VEKHLSSIGVSYDNFIMCSVNNGKVSTMYSMISKVSDIVDADGKAICFQMPPTNFLGQKPVLPSPELGSKSDNNFGLGNDWVKTVI
jgi:hypothetical protein